ncbi:MAG: radical SAM protein [bacterium]|nr:radical SAM protein [bacterium]
MKYCLISPRLAVQKADFLGSGVPYWPLELATTSAFLEKRGDTVEVFDLFGLGTTVLEDNGDHYLQGLSIKKFLSGDRINKCDRVIIFAISYMSHLETLSIVKELKALWPSKPVIILENSQAVTAYSLSHISKDFFDAGADFLVCGEPYWNWEEIESFINSPASNKTAENVLWKGDPAKIITRKFAKIPSYLPPAWEHFPIKNYWALPYSHGPKRFKNFLPIFTSRGCPYPCDFCVVPATNNKRWRGRTAEEVVSEMLYLRDKFKVHYFQVEDLNPTVQSERWDDICKLLIEKKAKVKFGFVSGTKAETVHIDQVKLLSQAGCSYISISPESGSASVMKAVGKPFNYEHGLKLVAECHKHGIYTQACFIAGHPSESEADHLLSCQYLKAMMRSGLDEVAVFVVSSLAGSKIYQNQSFQMNSKNTLPSFSPKGRENWQLLSTRRQELIRIFFIEKIRRGTRIWSQGIRAVLGIPRTKMENLPRRVLFIYWLLIKRWLMAKKAS